MAQLPHNPAAGAGMHEARAVPRASHRLVRVLWFIVLLVHSPVARSAEDLPPSEYQVKAALLLNFVRYTTWPTNAFVNPGSPYVVGVAGRDPFGEGLEKVFEGQAVRGRKFVLKRVSTEQDMRACHLLFISPSERRRTTELLKKLAGAPVLTVGESPEFLEQGGMINLLLKNESVRFEINLEPARVARLKLDANLVRAAASVRGKHE